MSESFSPEAITKAIVENNWTIFIQEYERLSMSFPDFKAWFSDIFSKVETRWVAKESGFCLMIHHRRSEMINHIYYHSPSYIQFGVHQIARYNIDMLAYVFENQWHLIPDEVAKDTPLFVLENGVFKKRPRFSRITPLMVHQVFNVSFEVLTLVLKCTEFKLDDLRQSSSGLYEPDEFIEYMCRLYFKWSDKVVSSLEQDDVWRSFMYSLDHDQLYDECIKLNKKYVVSNNGVTAIKNALKRISESKREIRILDELMPSQLVQYEITPYI